MVLGVSQGYRQHNHSIESIWPIFDFNRKLAPILYHSIVAVHTYTSSVTKQDGHVTAINICVDAFVCMCVWSTLLKQESIVTVRGVPMTDYMENLIKSTMASKAGQVYMHLHC